MPWQRLPNATRPASDAKIRITHPFHPLCGQAFTFVVSKELYGQERVTFELPDGACRSVPTGWTDYEPPDPYLSIGGGRSRFRVEDLLALVDLIEQVKR